MTRELELIIKYINPEFKPGDTKPANLNGINWSEIFKLVFSTNIDLVFLNNILKDYPNLNDKNPRFGEIKKLTDQEFRGIAPTIKHFTKLASENNIKYLFFKSLNPYKCIKNNIDVWIKNPEGYETMREILRTHGFEICHEHENSVHLQKEGFTMLDLHLNISWNYAGHGGVGPELFDLNLIWDRSITIDYRKIPVQIPSAEDEILLLLAHAIFQHNYLTLGEIISVGELARNNTIDYKYIFKQARKYKWDFALKECLKIVTNFYTLAWDITLDIPYEKSDGFNFSSYYSFGLKIPILLLIKKGEFNLGENSYLKYLAKCGFSLYRIVYYLSLKSTLPFNSCPDFVRN